MGRFRLRTKLALVALTWVFMFRQFRGYQLQVGGLAPAAARYAGFALDGARVAVQGFGNVGSTTALLLQEQGCTITGISDIAQLYFDDTEIPTRVKNGQIELALAIRTGESETHPSCPKC